jgi:hypothetical protein
MRVEQSEVAFQPVTIHLDSQDEVNGFVEMLTVAYNNSSSGSDAERIADQLRDQINKHGWQSSSYNC